MKSTRARSLGHWAWLACWWSLASAAAAQPGGAPGDSAGAATAPQFEADILPLFNRRCVACHGVSKKSGGLRLDSLPAVLEGSRKGPVVVPGKSDDSRILERVQATGKKRMPPEDEGEALAAAEIDLIRHWIDAGAPGDASGTKPHERVPEAVELGHLPVGFRPVLALAAAPDGAWLAAGRGAEIAIYRLDAPAEEASRPARILRGHADAVQSLAVSPDGAILASGGFREVILWDVASGAERARLGPHADRVLALAFSPDGQSLAAGGGEPSASGEIRLWDVATGKLIRSIDDVHSDTVFSVSFRPDGKVLASGAADRVVALTDLASGKRLAALEGHTHHVLAVRFRPDGKTLYSAGADAKIKAWDVEKLAKIKDWEGHGKAVTDLAVQRDGGRVASVSGDRTLRLWSPDGGQQRSFGDANTYLYAVVFIGDGATVATGGLDGSVRIYDVNAGKLLRTLAPE